MMFKVKDLDIATAGPLVIVVNQKDAQRLDLHANDRVLVKKGRSKSVVIVDISEDPKSIRKGYIGAFEEVLDKLNLKDGDEVELDYARKPLSLQLIKKKLDGDHLDDAEYDIIIADVVNDELSEGELTYFVAGCYTRGLHTHETVSLTKAIVKHGKTLNVCPDCVVDKHCIGGVPGNRTTMIVVPILAAAGLMVPKTSSRSITSPAGTADTMEVLCNVTLPVKKMERIVKKVGGCIAWGGGVNLAAADDKLIRVRHSLSIDPKGMLLASILAKKKAVGAKHVLLDIPVGKHTKIKTRHQANKLRRDFYKVGRLLGMNVHVVITNGEQPIGNGIGPCLEAKDVLYIFRRDERAPKDLEKKSLMLAARLLKIAGKKEPAKLAKQILESGIAYTKFKEIIKAQGGNPDIDPDKIKVGEFTKVIRAKSSGRLDDINTAIISRIARMAGAPLDKEAGIFMHAREGQRVKKGQPIFTIYAKSKANLHFATKVYNQELGILISQYVDREI